MVASVAIARSDDARRLLGVGEDTETVALTEGFQRGVLVTAGLSLAAALAAGVLLRRAERRSAPQSDDDASGEASLEVRVLEEIRT